jgi:hypothetical protein
VLIARGLHSEAIHAAHDQMRPLRGRSVLNRRSDEHLPLNSEADPLEPVVCLSEAPHPKTQPDQDQELGTTPRQQCVRRLPGRLLNASQDQRTQPLNRRKARVIVHLAEATRSTRQGRTHARPPG